MRTQRPNIVFLTWHDAGRWFGGYGCPTVRTPHVDRLAAEGVRFSNHFSACAICSPSRAAIMTGTTCQRNGVMTLTNSVFANRIRPDIPHLAARARGLGYRTALFGIQHECAHEHVHEVLRPDECFATDPWANADLIAHYARHWLREREREDRPFYAQIGTYDAHLNRFYDNRPPLASEPYPPVQDTARGVGVPPYLAGSEADRATVATLQGLLNRGDRLVGAVLDALDEAGLSDRTLVVMCVDHGPGLSRAKTTCYDAGTGVAWLLRWPGVLPAGRVVDALCGHVDVLPTIWDLLGQGRPEPCDGVSLAAHALGRSDAPVREAVFSHMVENTRSVRTLAHKFIRNVRPPRWPAGHKGDCAEQHEGFPGDYAKPPAGVVPCPDWPAVELYDLARDPDELRNLAADPAHAAVRDELDSRLWSFLLDQDDFIVHDPVRTPWQLATRRDLEAYGARVGRAVPAAEGPLADPCDAASAAGTTAPWPVRRMA